MLVVSKEAEFLNAFFSQMQNDLKILLKLLE